MRNIEMINRAREKANRNKDRGDCGLRVGSWSTRGIGATMGTIDPAITAEAMVGTWNARK